MTMNLFDIINEELTERAKFCLFDAIPEYQKKIFILKKLIESYHRLKQNFWENWKNKLNDIRLKDEQKGKAIQNLEDLLDEKRKKSMKQAL